MYYLNKLTKLSLAAATTIMLASCSKEEPTTYVEKVTVKKEAAPVAKQMPAVTAPNTDSDIPSAPKAKEGLSWNKPASWGEERKGGMILVNFTIPEMKKYRCYISSLRGNGGGLEPNIQRWFGQIGLPQIAEKTKMAEFIAKQDEFKIPGAHVMMIDFTTLASNNSAPSMIVGVVSYPDQTLYVKLQGAASEISKHKADLTALTKSIVR